MTERTADDVIEGFASSDLPVSDQLYMYVQLCDEKVLMKELNLQAMLSKVGLQDVSPLAVFVYGALRIAKPYLFEEKKGDGNET